MPRPHTKPSNGRHRAPRLPSEPVAEPPVVTSGAPFDLEEIERVARIGSYALDVESGRWVSSPGLDALLGIGPGFERSIGGWASLIHPADRDAAVRYLRDVVLGARRPFDHGYRIVRNDTGEQRWVHGRGQLELDASGRPRRMVGTIADVTEQHAAEEALAASERRYAAILEGTSEAILIADQATLRLRWVNAAATALLGYTRAELSELSIRDIHPADALPTVLVQLEALGHGSDVHRSTPCRRKDGSIVLADIRASVVDIDGAPHLVGVFADVTEIRRLEVHDRKLALALEQATDAILIAGPSGEIEYANPAFERLSGVGRDALVGQPSDMFTNHGPDVTFGAMRETVSTGTPWRGDLTHRRPDGEERVAEVSVSPVHETDDAIAGYVAVQRDVTAERALRAERERLVAAVEQTSDSVIIADLAGTIEYVNPSFERVSGYARHEAVGQNPRILKSGHQPDAFYRSLWRSLTRGESWTGPLINRRKDGTLYEEEATISPIRGPGGAVTGYVAVKRDVTAVRIAESNLAAELRERAQVAAALARLQPSPRVEDTAAAVCDELLALPSIDVAAIIDFTAPGRAVVLAAGGSHGTPLAPNEALPTERAHYLHQRALQGPWAEPWRTQVADGALADAAATLGIKAAAYAPIRNGDGLLGLVAAGTCDEAYARHMIDHLPVVGEFAATAGALLSGQLEWFHRSDLRRSRIEQILADRPFHPVFQPVVSLRSATPVGYEALTRFTDGTPPDRVLAEAQLADLGPELELAMVADAVAASSALPAKRWLSLNVSPDVILRTEALAELLGRASRRVVLEVTEHAEVDDYAAVRAAVARLGPRVSLAVDDAGSGFASLRHVVELRPRFLKLDISLVHQVDRDLTRQAMVAGLTQFAQRARCTVIAEGIEEPAELAMLSELGVPLGQGYLLGRPAPLGRTPRSGRRSGSRTGPQPPAAPSSGPRARRTGAGRSDHALQASGAGCP